MTIKIVYFTFVTLIHLIIVIFSYHTFYEQKVVFFVIEFFVFVSFYIFVRLYRALVKPLELISSGINAIKSRDFNVRFSASGSTEVDNLTETYNSMISQLREESIHQEEQHLFLEKLIHTSPVGIIILDSKNCISKVNPKAYALLNLPKQQVLNLPIADIAHPIAKVMPELKSKQSKTIRIDGVQILKCYKSHFMYQGFHQHFLILEELTNEVLEMEKKAYGKVIRMMAHEVNNSNGVINSLMHSLLRYAPQLQADDQSDYQAALTTSIQRNERVSNFMKNFAEVVRLPLPVREPYDICVLINTAITLFHSKAQEQNIQLIFDQPEAPFLVDIDVSQIEHALINITKNAIESIEQDGTITFQIDAPSKTLSITDTGKGIPKALEEQLFSPFFSTKENGQGIGLTLIKEIFIGHGFEFSLKSSEGGGAVFRIVFGGN